VVQCFSGSDFRLADGQWHQFVDSCSGNQLQLYFDGRPLLSASVRDCGDAGAVRFGAPASGAGLALSGFSGQMDEVRLYPRGLSAQEVRDLYQQPVFRMNFEQHAAWTDAGDYHTPVACSGATCPSHDALGATGWGAAFDGSDSLSVGATYPNAHLNLSGGQFTLSAWLYPDSGCIGSGNQSILGTLPSSTAYPWLGLDGGQVAVRVAGFYAVSDVRLTGNAWNHLAVAYDYAGGGGP
jgi:hypothetical protein